MVLMTGHESTILEWVAVQRLVIPFARFLCYDRTGLGKSEDYATPRKMHTAEAIAQDLDMLLTNMRVAPPYIMVGHSWGGVLVREFLHLRKPDEVVGMVFVDANSETTFLRPQEMPYACFDAVGEGVNHREISGELEHHVLTAEEFAAVQQAYEDPRLGVTSMAEAEGFRACFLVLAAKNQLATHALGKYAISVIHASWTARDFQRVYDGGVQRGNGTERDREEYRDLIADWDARSGPTMKLILGLSSDPTLGVYRETMKSGHNVQLLEPEIIVEEIRRVYKCEYEMKGGMI